ncbi:MAG: hypothetical protein M1480_12960 [Bacteroidetes bacterium]|nr:hypothetical protein [Bacteroidota bacterium]
MQDIIPLNQKFRREEDFNEEMSNHLHFLDVGDFEDSETEANVGTRQADIVAQGNDGVLVVECQFGKADWDHWGRLEAYARLKKADVAVLLAEDFEELMIVTCNLRNEDSEISWYLIQVKVNAHDEFSFIPIVQPAIDIQTERGDSEYSEFWEPIRAEGLFSGKPVPKRDEGWITKGVQGATLVLNVNKHSTVIKIDFKGEDRIEKRGKVFQILQELNYQMNNHETPRIAQIIIHVFDRGRADIESWDEIRNKLIEQATIIYNKLFSITI